MSHITSMLETYPKDLGGIDRGGVQVRGVVQRGGERAPLPIMWGWTLPPHRSTPSADASTSGLHVLDGYASRWATRSSSECTPCHSVAGLLPSTGLLQSKLVSRFGMKFAWKYAMFPSASAKSVMRAA